MADYASVRVEGQKSLRKKIFLSVWEAVICLLSTQVIFHQSAPFGIAAYSILQLRHRPSWIVTIGMCAGLFVSRLPDKSWHFGMVLIVLLISLASKARAVRVGMVQTGVLVSMLMVMETLSQVLLSNALTWMSVLHLIAGMLMAWAMVLSLNCLVRRMRFGQVKSMRMREQLSMLFVVSIMLSGIWELPGGIFSFKMAAFLLLGMVFANVYGAVEGACAVIIMGILIRLVDGGSFDSIAFYAAGTMASGAVKKYGRLLSAFSFFILSTTLMLLTDVPAEIYARISTALVASLLFVSFPSKPLFLLENLWSADRRNTLEGLQYQKKLQKKLASTIREFSDAHRDLAMHFSRLIAQDDAYQSVDAKDLAGYVADSACSGCQSFKRCWGGHSKRMFKYLVIMAELVEKNGRLEYREIPREFSASCENARSMCDWLNETYENYKLEEEWRARLQKHRHITAKQLEGIADATNQLVQRMRKGIKLLPDIECRIEEKLTEKGLRPRNISVANHGDDYEVTIQMGAEFIPFINSKSDLIEQTVNELLDFPMFLEKTEIFMDGQCELKLNKAERYGIANAVIRKPKTVLCECGDNYSCTRFNGTHYLLCLSDGMGSGLDAAEESAIVVSLIEAFIQAGYDIELTIETINSILSSRTARESFATVDICMVNLSDGIAAFIKVGAEPTFVKRGNHVEIIRKTNLPVGILESIEMEKLTMKLEKDDLIVMVTDGVLEKMGKENNCVQELCRFLSGIDSLNPDYIAQTIMERANFHVDESKQDDMTVMVGRIMEQR